MRASFKRTRSSGVVALWAVLASLATVATGCAGSSSAKPGISQAGATTAPTGEAGRPPTTAAITPAASAAPDDFDEGLVWGARADEVWAIDPAVDRVTRRIPLTDLMEILALDIDGDEAWIAARRPGYRGTVVRVDLATGLVVDEFAVSLPSAVRIAADRVWVTSDETNELLGFRR